MDAPLPQHKRDLIVSLCKQGKTIKEICALAQVGKNVVSRYRPLSCKVRRDKKEAAKTFKGLSMI